MKTLFILGILGVGVYASVVGLFLYAIGVPYVVKDQIHQKVSLQNGSFTYPEWKSLNFLQYNVYFFNITNPNEVMIGEVPIVKEVGPFCYNLKKHKQELDINEEEDTITYVESKIFYETSTNYGKRCLSADKELVLINIPLIMILSIFKNLKPELFIALSQSLPLLFPNIKDPFLRIKARDILFDGVKLNCDKNNIDEIDDDETEENDKLDQICEGIKKLELPQIRKHENGIDYVFASLFYQNNTIEGPFKIIRGVENITDVGKIIEYKDKKNLDYWKSDLCDQFGGNDGYILPPISQNKKIVDIFFTDFCRLTKFRYTEDTDILGIDAKHFEIMEDVLDNSDENKCFCPAEIDKETEKENTVCLEKGVINLSPCLNQTPIILSWPHFYLATKEYQSFVQGLNSDREKHRSEKNIEPKTGYVLSGSKRIQINLFLEKYEEIEIFKEIKEGLMPIFWFEESSKILKEYRTLLKVILSILKLLDFFLLGMIIAGLLLIISSVGLFIYYKKIKIGDSKGQIQAIQPFDASKNYVILNGKNSLTDIYHQSGNILSNVSGQNKNLMSNNLDSNMNNNSIQNGNSDLVNHYNAINARKNAQPIMFKESKGGDRENEEDMGTKHQPYSYYN